MDKSLLLRVAPFSEIMLKIFKIRHLIYKSGIVLIWKISKIREWINLSPGNICFRNSRKLKLSGYSGLKRF